MDNFDLKKYLAEGKLLKETFVKLSDEQKKKVKDAAKRGEAPEDVIDSDFGGDDKYLQSVMDLMTQNLDTEEGKLLKEDSEYFHRGADGAQTIIVPDDLGKVDSDEFYDQLEGLSDGQMSEMDFEINKEYEVYMGGDDIIFKLVKQGNYLIIDKDSIKIE